MADAGTLQPDDTVSYWLEQIEDAQRYRENWYTRGKKVIKRYADIEDDGKLRSRQMNVLWSNVETIKPALYSKTPSPKVSRRYRDKDPVGRWGAIVMERGIEYQFDAYDVDYNIQNAIKDYLLPGMGQIWVSYEPTIAPGAGAQGGEVLEWERVNNRYIHWRDYLTNPARTEEEIWWKAKREWMTESEVTKRFGKAIARKLVFSEHKESDRGDTDKGARVKKAPVWEIWCKPRKLVYFISKNCEMPLEAPAAPFLKFDEFFPCPRPLVTTTVTDSILPIPDYCQYQDQAAEIDDLTRRIGLMTQALRVVGLYDASQGSLGNLLGSGSGTDNQMVPCDNWAVMASQGGIKGSVDFFPLDEIIKTLQQCYVSREQAKQAMYEITGISDIVRGASDPNETLGAQQIKTQWGGLRIRDRQREVQRFVRDIMRLNAEVIAENFQPETLRTMSNAPLFSRQEKAQLQQRMALAQQQQQFQQAAQSDPAAAQQTAMQNPALLQPVPPPSLDDKQKLQEPAWEDVFQLLKDERLRCYRIEVETDSTINVDDQAEKTQRTEFLTAMATYITTLGPVVMQQPKFAPLFGEMMKFGARAFRTADILESSIEETVDALEQQALQPPPPPPPDPKIDLERQKMQSEDAFRRYQIQSDAQYKLQSEQQKHQADIVKAKPVISDAAALQPILEPILRSMFAVQQEQMAAMQQTMTQAVTQIASQQTAALTAIASMAATPKQLTVVRDKTGKIAGGMSAPIMQ